MQEAQLQDAQRAWPSPGILSRSLDWPPALPRISEPELGDAYAKLSELAGGCSLVILALHNRLPKDRFSEFAEKVGMAFEGNQSLFQRAAWAAQIAKTTPEPARCSGVVMPTMHAAVIQLACNFAHDTTIGTWVKLKEYMPVMDLPDVGLRLGAEFELARKYIEATTESKSTQDRNEIINAMSPALRGAIRVYDLACLKLPDEPTISEVHNWLAQNLREFRDELAEPYRLPKLSAFGRNIRRARERLNEQRNRPRPGRSGRSIIAANDK